MATVHETLGARMRRSTPLHTPSPPQPDSPLLPLLTRCNDGRNQGNILTMSLGHPLRALWAARSVAVVGASDRAGSLGRLPIDFLLRHGYAGRILPVRPDGAAVVGLPSHASVAAAAAETGPVDLAMIMVAAARVPEAVADCIAAGVPTAIVCTSGFAETGAAGAALQDEVVAMAAAGGLRLVGPNCIGSVGVRTGQVSSFSPLFGGANTTLLPGDLGFVSQSGALGYGAVSLAWERGLGLGWVVNTGNEADVSAAEVIAVVADEPGCRGVLAYVESLNGLDHLRRVVDSGLPLAILKAGRSEAGAAAAASHTGALATGDRLVDAALRQLGAHRVDDVDDLLDAGEVMGLPPMNGRRVAVVTTSGGSGILATDALETAGMSLSQLSADNTAALDAIVPAYGSTANPVDVTASVMSDPSLFDRALAAIAADPEVDAILACFCVLTGSDVDAVVDALRRVREQSGKPVVAVRTGADHLAPDARAAMRAAGIPCFPTPARGVRALAALATFSTPRPVSSRVDVADGGDGADAEALRPKLSDGPTADADEATLKALLAQAGLPIPHGRVVHSREDAAAGVEECGGRSVFKALVPGLLHKSDAGGVILGVTADGAGAAYDRIAALGGEVWCEEMVGGGIEALVGVAPSPLGTVLTIGLGGVLTEVMSDVSLRLLPVNRNDIEDMIDETRLGTLLAGVRGAPPADRAALVDTVLTLAGLIPRWPAGELDLNPVTVLAEGKGVRILDAAWSAHEPQATTSNHQEH